jgi:hypothetical protein
MTLLPTQWESVLREAQAAITAYYIDLRDEDSTKPKVAAINQRITLALSDQGAKDTANALGAVRLAAEQAYRDLVAVGACIAPKLEALEDTPADRLGEHVGAIRHGLEHLRDAAALLLRAIADDVEGPGREIADNLRYLHTLLAGLLAKDRGSLNLKEAGQELGQIHHQMRERIRLADRASVYLAWLERLCYLLIDGTPVQDARAKAALYAQAARAFLEGSYPSGECIDHPLMRDPRQGTQATAETPMTGGQAGEGKGS